MPASKLTGADPKLVRAWLRQARSDLEAARADVAAEGRREKRPPRHRRYWLQQACEKALEALGLLPWTGTASDEGQFRQYFLHRHDPLRWMQADPRLPRSLAKFLRQLEAELRRIDDASLSSKVDATTPSTNPPETSYRYPFVDANGNPIAPADWETADLDA